MPATQTIHQSKCTFYLILFTPIYTKYFIGVRSKYLIVTINIDKIDWCHIQSGIPFIVSKQSDIGSLYIDTLQSKIRTHPYISFFIFCDGTYIFHFHAFIFQLHQSAGILFVIKKNQSLCCCNPQTISGIQTELTYRSRKISCTYRSQLIRSHLFSYRINIQNSGMLIPQP